MLGWTFVYLILLFSLGLWPRGGCRCYLLLGYRDRLSALNSHAEIQAHLLVVVWPCTGTTWGLPPPEHFPHMGQHPPSHVIQVLPRIMIVILLLYSSPLFSLPSYTWHQDALPGWLGLAVIFDFCYLFQSKSVSAWPPASQRLPPLKYNVLNNFTLCHFISYLFFIIYF